MTNATIRIVEEEKWRYQNIADNEEKEATVMKKFFSIMIMLCMLTSVISVGVINTQALETSTAGDQRTTLIVELEGDTLLGTQGAVKLGSGAFQKTNEAQSVLQSIDGAQSSVEEEIEDAIGDDVEIKYSYTHVFNGISFEAQSSDIDEIEAIPGVKNVYETQVLYLSTNNSSDNTTDSITQATKTFSSGEMINLSTVNNVGYDGEGTAVAVIDGGCYYNHDVFRLSDASKAKYSYGDIAGIIGSNTMNSTNISVDKVYKNAKIPFAFDYGDNDASIDSNKAGGTSSIDHGTHVSGIIAGNNNIVTGIVPEAQLLMFKVDTNGAQVFLETLIAALDDAVKFDVSSINMSVGLDYEMQNSPAYSPVTRIINTARNAGISVCCAAGNSGKGPYLPETSNIDYSSSGVPNSLSGTTSVASVDSGENPKTLSYYTSWGTTESLGLCVDITAPGGSVYSSVGSGYANYSGTSMASPHVAGSAAIIDEYLSVKYPSYTGRAKSDLTENLMMSTARVISNNGISQSPRVQGAGMIDLLAIIRTNAILKNSQGNTQINLYDNLNSEFSFSFIAENISDKVVTFTSAKLNVTTDDCYQSAGEYYVADTNTALTFTAVTSADSGVTIQPHSSQTITVTVKLDENQLAANMQKFTNGFFIDGFVTLIDGSGISGNLSIPFMGYYGDWRDAPVMRAATVYDSYSTLTNSTPAVVLLRGAKGFTFDLLDAAGNIVFTSKKYYMARNTMYSYAFTNELNSLANGTYKVRYTAYIDYTNSSLEPQVFYGEYTHTSGTGNITENPDDTDEEADTTVPTVNSSVHIEEYTDTSGRRVLKLISPKDNIRNITVKGRTLFSVTYGKKENFYSATKTSGGDYVYEMSIGKPLKNLEVTALDSSGGEKVFNQCSSFIQFLSRLFLRSV